MNLADYQDKLQKLSQEIQYLDQQRSSRIEEALKVQGAIEALQQLHTEPETTNDTND